MTRLDLLVERAAIGGRMIARHDGRVVLVSGAIPGERVRARVERTQKHVMWAKTVEVLEASPDRRVPHCDAACGGSDYVHIAYERQRAIKADVLADAFRRIGKLPLESPVAVAASPEGGYRLRARLQIDGRRWGFFREGSHEICDAVATRQLLPETSAAVDRAIAALGALAPLVSEVIVAENVAATARVLHLELRPEARWSADMPLPETIGLTGMTVAHAGAPARLLYGADVVTDEATDVWSADAPTGTTMRWSRRARSFFQGNRFLLGTLLRRVMDAAVGDRVADLYAGVGLFTVALASRGAHVLAVEGDECSAGDLARNASPFGSQVDVQHRGVEDALRDRPSASLDALVVDPPRQGLSAEALAGVLAWRVRRVVYVSCDPPTLARDAGRLVTAGYRMTSIDALDLFPNTPHVEAVVVFDLT